MAKTNRISENQREYLRFVNEHPGVCTAQIVRACKRNPQAGHKWIYDSIGRLLKRGFLVSHTGQDRRKGLLVITPKGLEALS